MAQSGESFEALLQQGIPESVHDRDVRIFAGFSHYYISWSKGPQESLPRAKSHFLIARKSYESSEKDSGYPFVLNVLGVTSLLMNATGDTSTTDEAKKLFIEASKLWLKDGNKEMYWSAQGNLGATYLHLAVRGVDKEQNIERGIKAIEDQLDAVKDKDRDGRYSGTHANLGYLYLNKGAPSSTDLLSAENHFLEASKANKNRSPWSPYIAAQNGLGRTYAMRVGLGIDVKSNLFKCIQAWDEVASIYQSYKDTEKYADVQIHMAQCYFEAAHKGGGYAENMQKSIALQKIATAYYKQLGLWPKYSSSQDRLVLTYMELVDRRIEMQTNLLQLKLALEEGINVFHKYGPADLEKRFAEIMKGIEKVLENNQKKAADRQLNITRVQFKRLLQGLCDQPPT